MSYPLGTTCANLSGTVYTSSYDSWGSVTSRTYSGTTSTLTYDLLDHFVSWNAGSNNKDLSVYDASGTRVLRRSVTSAGTTMTVYAFGQEEHRYGGAGVHQSDLYYYTVGGRLLGASDGTSTTFYLTDTLGSVLASFSNVANSVAIQGNQVFGPYGNPRDYQGTINTAKGFTGQYADSLTGLDYYGSRYYHQVAGVFLSADVVQGNGSGENPYAYVAGNPETYSDPSGQMLILPGEGGGGEAEQGGDVSGTGIGGSEGAGGDIGASTEDVGIVSTSPSVTQVTVGDTTYTLDPATNEVTVHVVNADGSEDWFTAQPGTTAYDQAQVAFQGFPDEGANVVAQGEGSSPGPLSVQPTGPEAANPGQVSEPEATSAQGNQPSTMNPNTDTAKIPQTLYHYTSPEGQAGILQSQSLNPSLQPPNIVYGTGQYLTDIAPEQIVGRIRADLIQDQVDQGSLSFSQLARRLYGQPWGLGNKLSRFLEIDVSGLAVENPAPYIYLIQGIEPLDLFNRIIRFGTTPFAP